MSAVYALEPPTEGKAVVRTTHGELEIEFFAREAPLACRNFVQLALEGCVNAREKTRDARLTKRRA
jgi:peptidyl-prolyl cis-trans isomerase SDCCAG10